MIRQTIAAVAVLIAASAVSLINSEPVTTVEPPAVVVRVPVEDDEGWDCRAVTEHSNGVCGAELPQGFTVQDIAECVTPSLYADCPGAVREKLGR